MHHFEGNLRAYKLNPGMSVSGAFGKHTRGHQSRVSGKVKGHAQVFLNPSLVEKANVVAWWIGVWIPMAEIKCVVLCKRSTEDSQGFMQTEKYLSSSNRTSHFHGAFISRLEA